MKQLWLGSNNEYLARLAKYVDPTSVLVNGSNYLSWLDSPESGYTSIADLPNAELQIWNCIMASNIVHYSPQHGWETDNSLYNENEKYVLEPLVLHGSNFTKTTGLEHINGLHCTIPEIKERQTDQNQLWVAGCSFSSATGVSKTENYGYLLGKHLDMPVTNIAKGGTDISWSADQILRSNIIAGDIVVWGITHWERFYHVHEGELHFIRPGWPPRPKENLKLSKQLHFSRYELFSENNLHRQLCSILQVENYCKKIGATLKCYNMFPGNSALDRFLFNKPYNVIRHFIPNFNDTPGLHEEFLDLGTNNMHPGPLTHQKYAKELLDSLQN